MMPSRRYAAMIWGLSLVVLAVLVILDLMTGQAGLGIKEIAGALAGGLDESVPASVIVWKLRMPRIVTAIIAGAGLAISGAQMQAVFRNSLADPHILGVSAGAGTGVAAATMLAGAAGLSGIGTTVAAASGAMLMALIIMGIASRVRKSSALLIAGVMLGYITGAVTSVIQYQADESRLKAFWSWSAGSFSGNTWNEIGIMAVALAAGFILSMLDNKRLSALLFGDDYAAASGINAERTRGFAMLSCCIVTGAVTAFCGPIGFIGIVAPHLARMISGHSAMSIVLPLSLVSGAVMSITGDLLSQLFRTPIPVGCATALIGIPIIFLILSKSKA